MNRIEMGLKSDEFTPSKDVLTVFNSFSSLANQYRFHILLVQNYGLAESYACGRVWNYLISGVSVYANALSTCAYPCVHDGITISF